MNGRISRKIRQIIVAKCTNISYNTDNYRYKQVFSVKSGTAYALELTDNNPRKLYKKLKRKYKAMKRGDGPGFNTERVM